MSSSASRKYAPGNPITAGSILQGLLKDFGIDRMIIRYRVWSVWEEIVGKQIAAHTRPGFYLGDCLFVIVDHSAWMHQLIFLKEPILAKINAEIGPDSLSEIRFRLGPVPPPPRPRLMSFRKIPPLRDAERKEVEVTLRGLPSSEWRETLRRVMIKDLSSKEVQPSK